MGGSGAGYARAASGPQSAPVFGSEAMVDTMLRRFRAAVSTCFPGKK
ncbi:MAG TPA: hypothetical protein PKO38_04560 [Bacillota bacterium]|nr:hypothetical protein [Bacillota bacterium]HOB86944.1 hypothetical protein [Bacillota bacterium]HOP69074.1 hypothetical protein [Bacillota bacterium]HPT34745.1 hypothetical protein [Bacillota bacterium]HPZ65315.1 hypothetical protein [Bacillota bacterium]